MTIEQIVHKCEEIMEIADANMETAAAEGDEAEAEFWNGRRLACCAILNFIFSDKRD